MKPAAAHSRQRGSRFGRFVLHGTALPRSLRKIWQNPSNRGHRISRTLGFLKMRTLWRGRTEPVEVDFGRKSRVLISPARGGSMQALYAPLPDYRHMRVWESCLKPGDLFVDVGAHVGFYSVLAAEIGADVIAVEPQQELVRFLHENLALNGYTADVRSVALADQPGELFLGGGADSSQHAIGRDERGELVRVETLDSIIGSRVVAGLKIDVEGAERLVLLGATHALTEGRILRIQLEWNRSSERNFGESRDELHSLLGGFGYTLFRPDTKGALRQISDPSPGLDVFALLRPCG